MRRPVPSFLRHVTCSVAVTVLLTGVLVASVAPPAAAGSLIDAINGARADRGLPPLAHFGDDTVVRSANDGFVESGREHGTVSTAAPWYFDRGATGFRENQAILPDSIASPGTVVQVWLASDTHAANLLAPEITHVAAASRSSAGRTFFTVHLLVGGPAPAPPPPAPPPPPEPAPEPPARPPDPPAEPPAERAASDIEGEPGDEDPVAGTSAAREDRDLSALRAPVPLTTSDGSARDHEPGARDAELPDLRSRWRAEQQGTRTRGQEVEVAGAMYERPAHGVAGTGDASVPLIGLTPGALALAIAALALVARRRRSRAIALRRGSSLT